MHFSCQLPPVQSCHFYKATMDTPCHIPCTAQLFLYHCLDCNIPDSLDKYKLHTDLEYDQAKGTRVKEMEAFSP